MRRDEMDELTPAELLLRLRQRPDAEKIVIIDPDTGIPWAPVSVVYKASTKEIRIG